MAPCIVIDAYIAPGSTMDLQTFYNQIDWVNYVYAVPNTYWGDRSPNINIGRFDIRWRFQDNEGRPTLQSLGGPVVDDPRINPNAPNRLGCGVGWSYRNLNDYLKFWLNYRPTGPGPFGQTNTLDIALYYVQGPFIGGFVEGCAPFLSPNGPAIVMSNSQQTGQPNIGGPLLAHELGHVLGLSNHVIDATNIMNQSILRDANNNFTTYRLTPQQANIIRANNRYWQNC